MRVLILTLSYDSMLWLRQRFTKDKNDKFEEVKSKKQLKKDKKAAGNAAAALAAKVNTNA